MTGETGERKVNLQVR